MYTRIGRILARETTPLLVTGSCLLLTLVLAVHVCLPRGLRVNARYRTYKNREETLSAQGNFARIRDELRDIHGQLSAKLAAISSGMGNPQDLSALLQMLIDRAKAADIRFVKMQPQSESTHADYIQYPVLLEMETTYHSLGQFVVALESMPHVVKIDRLAITAGASGKIDAKLLVTCFLQRT